MTVVGRGACQKDNCSAVSIQQFLSRHEIVVNSFVEGFSPEFEDEVELEEQRTNPEDLCLSIVSLLRVTKFDCNVIPNADIRPGGIVCYIRKRNIF